MPRSVRRAAHPVRAVRRAVTPRSVKRISRTFSPIDNAIYAAERRIFTKKRGSSQVFTHDGCGTQHRSTEAANRCRKGASVESSYESTQQTQEASDPNYYRCLNCGREAPIGASTCVYCQHKFMDDSCFRCKGDWQLKRLDGELAMYCPRCDWYMTEKGLVRSVPVSSLTPAEQKRHDRGQQISRRE